MIVSYIVALVIVALIIAAMIKYLPRD